MKKMISIVIIGITILLSGCSNDTSEKVNEIQPPINMKLSIEGEWEITNFKVLEKSTAEKSDSDIIGETIKISSNAFEFEEKKYIGINHKLKIAKDDYLLSYESKFSIKDLGFDQEKTEVYSANYKQNILYEFFKGSNEKSYLYFSGIIYEVKRVGDIEEPIYAQSVEYSDKEKNDTTMPEGVLLGLKTPGKMNDSGELTKESYRTLWISVNDKKLTTVEEREHIIFPRLDGIWSIEKNTEKRDNMYVEYFEAKSLDGKSSQESLIPVPSSNLYRTIKFVGNDYIATEVYEGNKFSNVYTRYEVLPVDNLLTNRPMVIQDIFSKESNAIYKADYNEQMKSVTEDQKTTLSKYISYDNFTLARGNGKWNMVGRISPIGNNLNYIDYPLNLKPNKKLLNYDTLIIPWKVLKGKIPFIKDAYTSPDGNIALIILENRLDIYNIYNGDIGGEPIASIELNEGEHVIMAEWCSGEYVNKWYNVFKEDSKKIK